MYEVQTHRINVFFRFVDKDAPGNQGRQWKEAKKRLLFPRSSQAARIQLCVYCVNDIVPVDI